MKKVLLFLLALGAIAPQSHAQKKNKQEPKETALSKTSFN